MNAQPPVEPAELARIASAAVTDELSQIGVTAAASAVQYSVWAHGSLEARGAYGYGILDPPRRPLGLDTPMDLASLTKLYTATLAMQAIDEGIWGWDTPLATIFSGWTDGWENPGRPATLLDLLNHSSGLPSWEKFYLRFPIDPDGPTAEATRRAVLAEIMATPKLDEPGRRHAYSDLGYIALGRALEHAFGAYLDTLVRDRITAPLGLTQTRFVSVFADDEPLRAAAATEHCPLRTRAVVGTVHDENTNIQGGVAGHAGLFGTADEVARFGEHLRRIHAGQIEGIVRAETLRFAWSEAARGAGNHLAGWDTPSGERSSAGRGFAPASTVGHLGFTGTSLWIDHGAEIVAVLLTNRVYPSRDNALIRSLRIRFHEAILRPPPTEAAST